MARIRADAKPTATNLVAAPNCARHRTSNSEEFDIPWPTTPGVPGKPGSAATVQRQPYRWRVNRFEPVKRKARSCALSLGHAAGASLQKS